MNSDAHGGQARGIFALFALAAALLLGGLGATDLWAPDEPRFGAVVQEMQRLDRGALDLVVLRLNGDVYTQKPPFFYWLSAAIGTLLGGVSEFSLRLPSALAGIASIAVCLALALRMTANATIGLMSGALLLSVHQFAHLARRAQLDVILTFFVSIGMLAYWHLHTRSTRPNRWLTVFHLALGLGLLTKGPVALLPILIMAIHLAWEGRLADMRRCFPVWGLALMVAPVLAWVGAATLLAPEGFFQTAVVDNIWGRFAHGTAHIRPFYYYLYHFPLDFLPWTLLWPAAAIHAYRVIRNSARDSEDAPERAATRLLVVWIATYFIFFSISAGKRGLYLLPCFPAVSILCAMALGRVFARRDDLPRPVALALVALALVTGGLGAWLAGSGGLPLARNPGFALPPLLGAALAAAALLGLAVYAFLARRGDVPLSMRFAVVVVTVLAVEGSVFGIAYPAFDREKSPRAIARAATAVTPAGSPIGIYDQRDLIGGIVYYGDRRATELRTPDEARAFFDAGGHAMIIKAKKLSRTGLADRLHVEQSTRSGSRRLLLVVPSGGS